VPRMARNLFAGIARPRRRVVAGVLAVALGLPVSIAVADESAGGVTPAGSAADLAERPAASLSSTDAAWASPAVAAPDLDARPLARRAPPTPGTAGPAVGSGGWLRTTGALLGVVALILLLGWGYRTVVAGGLPTLRGGRAPLIEVVSRAALGPRQAVCLVRVGPRLVLLGMTATAIRALDVIDNAALVAQLLGEARAHRPDSATAEFNQCLERESRSYAPPSEPPAAPAPDPQRILGVRDRLAETLSRLRRVGAA